MTKKVYNKLVRDKIPEIIRQNNAHPTISILDEAAHIEALIAKLKEELAEFEEARSLEELADIKEVFIAIREALGFSAGELEDIKNQKTTNNGRFKKRIFLESVDE